MHIFVHNKLDFKLRIVISVGGIRNSVLNTTVAPSQRKDSEEVRKGVSQGLVTGICKVRAAPMDVY